MVPVLNVNLPSGEQCFQQPLPWLSAFEWPTPPKSPEGLSTVWTRAKKEQIRNNDVGPQEGANLCRGWGECLNRTCPRARELEIWVSKRFGHMASNVLYRQPCPWRCAMKVMQAVSFNLVASQQARVAANMVPRHLARNAEEPSCGRIAEPHLYRQRQDKCPAT